MRMPCTTILVGKNASYDGSTLVARNEDSSNGVFEPKRMRVVHPDEQPRVYTSVLSHLTVELPDNPMRYTSVPDVVPGHGIWAEAGFNELNVGMSATETLTTNERVRGADPLVDYVPAKGNEGEDGYVPAQPGGLGEEDMVTLVLPYAKSARDGVRILGDLSSATAPTRTTASPLVTLTRSGGSRPSVGTTGSPSACPMTPM